MICVVLILAAVNGSVRSIIPMEPGSGGWSEWGPYVQLTMSGDLWQTRGAVVYQYSVISNCWLYMPIWCFVVPYTHPGETRLLCLV